MASTQTLRKELKRKSTNEIGIYQSEDGFKTPILEQNVSEVLFKDGAYFCYCAYVLRIS